jgi:protein SCO1/2
MPDQDTPEDSIAAFVDEVRRSPGRRDSLVALLPERLPLYAGRSTNATIRIRGYILAAFERVGLPEAALPYVLEELETGRDAYGVAAAARALRGLDRPTGQLVPFLFKAIQNMRYLDDAVAFESYKPRWPVRNCTSALEEIFETLAWLGHHARSARPDLEALRDERGAFSAAVSAALERAIDAIRTGREDVGADCCAAPIGLDTPPETLPSPRPPAASSRAASIELILPGGRARDERRDAAVPTGVELEDQDGRTLTYGRFFGDGPSIVVFFYSRCDNPNKCSLTVTKLGRLQGAIREAGLAGRLKTAAITYDPEYDLPPRLRAYGENRGVLFGEGDRFFRSPTGLKALREYFDLGVNFGHSLVNRHRIELYVLDRQGKVAVTFSRLQWDVHEVLDQARALLVAGGG